MQLLINHWRVLQRPIIGWAVSLMIVFLLIGVATHYQRNQTVKLNIVRADYESARESLQLFKQQQQDIEQYLLKYQHLLQTGFIGEEQRRLWIARLHQVGIQHQLFTIDYKIDQQTAYDAKLISGGYKMHRSVMTLRWSLLHEDDFKHLLSGLREGTSPFIVRDCEITQVADMAINNPSLAENLIASCAIDWLTIQDSSGKADL